MNILVFGGRDYSNAAILFQLLDAVAAEFKFHDITIVNGGAKGADYLSGMWAFSRKRKVRVFKADWNKYGKGAGPIRNQQMIAEGQIDLAIGFPGGRGTEDMANRCLANKIPLRRIT